MCTWSLQSTSVQTVYKCPAKEEGEQTGDQPSAKAELRSGARMLVKRLRCGMRWAPHQAGLCALRSRIVYTGSCAAVCAAGGRQWVRLRETTNDDGQWGSGAIMFGALRRAVVTLVKSKEMQGLCRGGSRRS